MSKYLYPHTVLARVSGQRWYLHPLKAAYWAEANVLLLADLHLGKATHFRKAGIAAPQEVEAANLDRVINLLLTFHPERVLLLGDLFHSVHNSVWEEWCELVEQFSMVRFELVPGNHDILRGEHYEQSGMLIHPLKYYEGPFVFTHEPLKSSEAAYNVYGHIHPGVRLRGHGRAYMRLPCFLFGEQHAILPAFGGFTGLADIPIKETDEVYGVTSEEVIVLQGE